MIEETAAPSSAAIAGCGFVGRAQNYGQNHSCSLRGPTQRLGQNIRIVLAPGIEQFVQFGSSDREHGTPLLVVRTEHDSNAHLSEWSRRLGGGLGSIKPRSGVRFETIAGFAEFFGAESLLREACRVKQCVASAALRALQAPSACSVCVRSSSPASRRIFASRTRSETLSTATSSPWSSRTAAPHMKMTTTRPRSPASTGASGGDQFGSAMSEWQALADTKERA